MMKENDMDLEYTVAIAKKDSDIAVELNKKANEKWKLVNSFERQSRNVVLIFAREKNN